MGVDDPTALCDQAQSHFELKRAGQVQCRVLAQRQSGRGGDFHRSIALDQAAVNAKLVAPLSGWDNNTWDLSDWFKDA